MSTIAPIIYLVACSASKAAEPKPARDLYLGELFTRSRELAEARGATWAILSAKHGLVMPDQVIEPYDERLPARVTAPQVYEWADGVAGQLMRCFPAGTHFVVLAGAVYRRVLELYADDIGYTWDAPMRGLGIGSQKRWLAQQTTEAA